MNKILLISSVIFLGLFSQVVRAGAWKNYNNFQLVTDAEPKGNEIYVTAKGGMLIVNTLTGAKKFYDTNNSSLPSNSVEQVSKSPISNDIWIGTYDNGIAKWTGTDFVPTAYPDNFGLLYGMKFGPDGNLYLQSSSGAFRFNINTKVFTQFNASNTGLWLYNAWSFDFNSDGNIVVFTGDNCYTVDVNTLEIIDSFSTLTTPLVSGCVPSASSIYYYDNNTVLFGLGTFDIGFINRDGTSSDAKSGLPAFTTFQLVRGQDNIMYGLLDNYTVYKLVGSTWQFLYDIGTGNSATNLFYEDGIESTMSTPDFNNTGVDLFTHNSSPSHLKTDTRAYPFTGSDMNSVYQDNTGSIFIVDATDVYKYDKSNDNWQYAYTAPAIFGSVRDVKFVNGKVYANEYGNLIEFYDGTTWTNVPRATGSLSIDIFSYDVTNTGAIYFSNGEGLFKYEAGVTTKLFATTSYVDWIYSVKYDQTRNVLWLGKAGRIGMYNFSGEIVFNHSNIDELPTDLSVQCITINPTDNSVWFGANHNTAFRYDGVDFSVYRTPDLTESFITQVLFAPNGSIVLKNGDGEGGFYTYKDGIWTRYNTAVMSDLASNAMESMLVDNEGNYWVAHGQFAQSGVSVYRNYGTSIINNENKVDFNVYPNPAKDILFVKLDRLDVHNIEMYSMLGELVYTNGEISNGLIKIDISKFKAGIYILKAGTSSMKVIVQ